MVRAGITLSNAILGSYALLTSWLLYAVGSMRRSLARRPRRRGTIDRKQIHSILLIRLDEMGDFVLFTPVLRSLRQAFRMPASLWFFVTGSAQWPSFAPTLTRSSLSPVGDPSGGNSRRIGNADAGSRVPAQSGPRGLTSPPASAMRRCVERRLPPPIMPARAHVLVVANRAAATPTLA